MLERNKIYTLIEITKMFGGNPQASMPFVNGHVVYCKFSPNINPEFPNKVWIEQGPLRNKGALFLIQTNSEIPIFKKVKGKGWYFMGYAKITDATTLASLKKINRNPPRDKVQFILKLNFINN